MLKIVSFGQARHVFEDLGNGDWNVPVSADLSVISADMRSRLVLPAGSGVPRRRVGTASHGG